MNSLYGEKSVEEINQKGLESYAKNNDTCKRIQI